MVFSSNGAFLGMLSRYTTSIEWIDGREEEIEYPLWHTAFGEYGPWWMYAQVVCPD